MKPQDAPDADERARQAPTRKAYRKPELQVYGDLAEITWGVMGSNTNDGSSHPNQHHTS